MSIYELLLKQWRFRQLSQLLKNRKVNHYVSLFFKDDEKAICFVKNGKRTNYCYLLKLSSYDFDKIRFYLQEGSFIIYRGAIQTSLVTYILDNKKKWKSVEIWEID